MTVDFEVFFFLLYSIIKLERFLAYALFSTIPATNVRLSLNYKVQHQNKSKRYGKLSKKFKKEIDNNCNKTKQKSSNDEIQNRVGEFEHLSK